MYKLNNIKEFFDKCCFVSQEENLQFLKTSNNDKAENLEFLFDIPMEQQNELKRVETILSLIKNGNHSNNLGYLKTINQKIESIKSIIDLEKDKVKNLNKESEIKYVKILPNKNINWDAEEINLSKEQFEEAIVEMENLKYFVENRESCLNYIFNKPFKELNSPYIGSSELQYNENKLEYALRYYPLIEQSEKYIKNYDTQEKFKELRECLTKHNWAKINWTFVKTEDLLSEEEVTNCKNHLDNIVNLKKTVGVAEGVILSIKNTRKTLIKYSEDAMKAGTIQDNECVLCGAEYTDNTELTKEFIDEETKLSSLSNYTTKNIEDLINEAFKIWLNNVNKKIDESLKDEISKEFYLKVKEVESLKIKLQSIQKCLESINLTLPTEYIEDLEIISEEFKKLTENIKLNLKNVELEVEEELVSKNFDSNFYKYFDKNEDEFKKLKIEIIEIKIKYVKSMYYNTSMNLINKKNEELLKMQKREVKLQELYQELENYSKSMVEGLKKYKQKIISDIEPLLFVYTAKILQQKFNGKSIFIMVNENMDKLQLVNSMEDKQDVLYTMSSGQLSAVSIAFMLCMNQVYVKNNALPMLLIDDPIQTIDDVNMVGLVDILRFEFQDKQIFISTHEQKFEWYLRYKYEKANKKIELINMKEIMLS